MWQEIAIALVERRGDWLVGRRGANMTFAGMWEFPGGKIESGESPEAAAVRECAEETGLAVRIVERWETVEHASPSRKLRLHFFRCEALDQDAAPQPPFAWLPAAALDDGEFPPANATILERIARL